MLVSFPLLIIPLAIYNMIVFLTPPDNGWATRIIQIQLPSGEQWTVTFGEIRPRLASRTCWDPWIATGTTGTPDSSASRPSPGLGSPRCFERERPPSAYMSTTPPRDRIE